MTIFLSKSEFFHFGAQPITPSTAHASHDCYICKDPLAVHPPTLALTTTTPFHPALGITSCGHIHGIECLTAWLNTSNTCPTCSRMLFEIDTKTTHHITQQDIDAIIRSLRHVYSEHSIMSVLARRVNRQYGEEEAVARRKMEEGRRSEVKEEVSRGSAFWLMERDWMDGHGELDVGDDDGDGDDDDENDDDDNADFGSGEVFGFDEDEDEEIQGVVR